MALAAGPALAANYYVSAASGSDADPGSQARPWKTLSKAAAAAQAGDSVLVLAGTYSDPASDAFRAFNPAQSGRPGAPIVFQSRPPRAATLASANPDNPAFGVNNRQYIVVDGFKVSGGIGFREHADHNVIRNCEVTKGFIQQGDVSLDWGIYLGGASRCLVEHNWVHAPAGLGNKTHNGAAIMVIGVPADCDSNVIQYNEADGGNLWYNAFGQKAGLISANVWRRNIARNAVCGFMGMGSTDNTKYSRDNRFQENLILDCRYAFELDHNCAGFRIVGNTAKGCSVFLYGGYRDDGYAGLSGMQVWNNIFAPAGGSGAFYQRDAKAPDWRALLAYSDYNAILGKPAVWNYGSGSQATLAAWRSASGFDAHSLSADPAFVDAAQGDFHLAGSSPCRHAGLDRGESPGYASLGPDQGIYPRPDPGAFVGYLWSGLPPAGPKRPRPPVNLPAPYYDPIPD
jgi:hypothetical protein